MNSRRLIEIITQNEAVISLNVNKSAMDSFNESLRVHMQVNMRINLQVNLKSTCKSPAEWRGLLPCFARRMGLAIQELPAARESPAKIANIFSIKRDFCASRRYNIPVGGERSSADLKHHRPKRQRRIAMTQTATFKGVFPPIC